MPRKNIESAREYSREYYNKNKDKINSKPYRQPAARRQEYFKYKARHYELSMQKKYGVGLEEKERMYLEQDSRCAICGNDLPGILQAHLDHNHENGAVRGLLCRACNHLIGNAKEDKAILINAINYLDKYKEEKNG